MNFRYGIKPETFKLVDGLYHGCNPMMIDEYDKTIALSCAKNDTAAFQIILSLDEGYTLNTGNAPYFAQKRKKTLRIAAKSELFCKLSIESLIPDDDRLLKADILENSPVKEYEANRVAAVYAEVTADSYIAAGEYEIQLEFYLSDMFSVEEKIAETAVTLRVFDYMLPNPSERDFFLDLWQHNCNLARKYDVEPWSDEHFDIMENYIYSMSELGQRTVTLIMSDTPWSGQWCHLEQRNEANLYEYSIVKIYKEKGTFTYDFSDAQRYIDLCAEYNINGEISLYGLVNVWCDNWGGFDSITPDHPDGLKLRYFDADQGVYKYMTAAAEVDGYIKAVHDYFVETEQIDRVRVVADEPHDTDAYRKITEHIKEIAPKFVFKAAINHSEFIPMFRDTVVDYVPSLLSLSKETDKILEYKNTMPDSRFTWYVCNNPPHPNVMVKNDLCEGLFLGVLTSYFGMDGFLRWNYTVWTDHPTEDIRYFNWPAGDLCFVYPGKDGKPMLSLRYKILKRGCDLCVLLNAYKEKFGSDAVKEFYDKVIFTKDVRDFYIDSKIIYRDKICSVEYADYDYIRRTILEKLS